MKTIGLLGGMSWESTTSYYQLINQQVKKQLGGLHSAKIILNSIDFEPLEILQHQGDWEGCASMLIAAAQNIEAAQADCLLICTNTMHKVYPQIASSLNVPVLHIADATAGEIKARGFKTVGLLGTKFTMEQDFYKGRLTHDHGIHVIIPVASERNLIHRAIYEELCLGEVKDNSRKEFLKIIDNLSSQGAEAIILGCTEISLLVKPEDCLTTLLDTTKIHALAAVKFALLDNKQPLLS